MYNNQFNNQFFNPQYVNPIYYQQIEQQIAQYQFEQTKEVINVMKAVKDLCEASKKLDPQHQQIAFEMALTVMAKEFGWSKQSV